MPQPREAFEGLPTLPPVRSEDVIEPLGDGLVLRRANAADIEAVAAFNAVVQADPPDFETLVHIENWTRQLMDGSHPSARASDFLLVQDTNGGRLASTLCLLSHQLAYAGVALPGGMPELVGTHPDYRHRKLVARQFEELHRWSDGRGDQLQIIDGIPWYYRQFGYEMAAQRFGGLRLPVAELPAKMPAGLRVRRAEAKDAGFLDAAYREGMQRYRLTCLRDEPFWRFELEGRHPFSTQTRVLYLVETEAGEPLSFFNLVPTLLDEGRAWTPVWEVGPGVAWERVIDAVLAALREHGEELARRDETTLNGATLALGLDHPCERFLAGRGEPRRPYAWYVRVPELPEFLRRVGPALAARLAASPLAGASGDLSLSDYRRGWRLHFEDGALREVGDWRPATDERGDAAFPDRTFLQLLFGHRSLAELESAFPDCVVFEAERRAWLEALFPKQPSFIMATS